MAMEPRFGHRDSLERAFGRMEARLESQQAQIARLEKALENMGKRLEAKIDGVGEMVAEAAQSGHSRDTAQNDRLDVLEHDRSRLLGATWAIRLLWLFLTGVGIGGLAALINWFQEATK